MLESVVDQAVPGLGRIATAVEKKVEPLARGVRIISASLTIVSRVLTN